MLLPLYVTMVPRVLETTFSGTRPTEQENAKDVVQAALLCLILKGFIIGMIDGVK